jgi:hypothetical protein
VFARGDLTTRSTPARGRRLIAVLPAGAATIRKLAGDVAGVPS